MDSPEHVQLHINHKETLAIVLAVKCWHKCWANKHIVIHSDNKTAVNIINKGSTPDQTIMTELRQLFWLSALFNFRITAQYIKGKHNTVADAISRLHESPYHIHILDSVLLRFFLPQLARILLLSQHMSLTRANCLIHRYAQPCTGSAAAPRNLPI